MSFFAKGSDHERRSAQWDLEAGFTNYAALLGGHLGGAALSFAAVWLAVRSLGPDGYGGIVALVAGSQLIGQLAVQWTAIAVFRHGCREFVDRGRIAGAFWNRLAILGVNFLLLGIAAPWWLPRVSSLLSIPPGGGALVVLHLLATSLAVHCQQSLLAAKLPRFQSLVQLVERGSVALALAILTLLGADTWRYFALVFALAPLLTAVLALFRLRPLILPLPRLEWSLMREMLRFSVPLIFFSVVGYLTTNHLDAVFVLRFLSSSDLGTYAIAYQIAGAFMQLASLLGSLFMGYFITADAEGDRGGLDRFFRSVLPTLTLAVSILAAFAAVAGSLLLQAFFGPALSHARPLLWPLMAAAGLAAPVTIAFGPITNARSRTSVAAVSAVVAAATNTLLNFVLIPALGLPGCAWATTAAFGASLLVFLLLAPSLVSVPRSWTLYATFPVVAGALLGVEGREWASLALALSTGALIGALRHADVRIALRALSAQPALQPLLLFWRSPRARVEFP
jgi:O-antigen/teichoic acid export membrane protein